MFPAVTPERFRLIEQVFHGALEVAGGDRARYLDHACAGDDDLRRRVDALVAQHDPKSAFLEPPPPATHPSTAHKAVVGRVVGRYKIVRLIASGGMGAVYEAEQERPLRRVALKVMRGGLSSERARRRFEFESQVLASLRHPGIAQVYEAGVHEDLGGPVPFFAMELVNGPSITEHCRQREMEQGGRVKLMVRVCEAVQHAHQRGVIHRDIKPSNILVETVGEKHDEAGDVPKVIDFGIARVVAGETPGGGVTQGTEAGGVLGTLAYMSPEQCAHAGGTGRSVDTRSDVYSLGVVMYELLCGALPYDITDKSIAETASIIATKAPARPSVMKASVKGDLETVLLKALEKEPERRYQSAGELARDLERYLALQPIEARPPTAFYQLRMFARRHRALVGVAGAMALVLVAATAVSVAFALVARRQTERAELGELRAHRRADFLQGALASANPWFPPEFPKEDLSDYEPWDEWQHSPWPYAGMQGRGASVADILMAAGERVGKEFADDPATRTRLSDTLGWTLMRMLTTEEHPRREEMLKQASVLLRDALAARRQMLGDNDEETIRSMMRLAEFLDYTGGIPEGGELYSEAWRRCKENWGAHDARTLHALRGLVNNHGFLQGKMQEGSDRLTEAVGWAMEDGKQAPAPVLITLSYHAFVRAHMNDCDGAEAMARRAVDVMTAQVGEVNIRTAFAQQFAGQAMLLCQKLELAEQYCRGAVAGHQAFFGEKSLEAAHRLSTLGEVLASERKWDEAADTWRRAHQLMLGIRGPDHPDTMSNQFMLAEALWFTGKSFKESEAMAVGTYERWAEITTPTHPFSLYMAMRLAEGGLIGRKFPETLVFLDKQIGYTDATRVDAYWGVVFRKMRAECLAALGRMPEAKLVAADALKRGRDGGVDSRLVEMVQELSETLGRGEMPTFETPPQERKGP